MPRLRNELRFESERSTWRFSRRNHGALLSLAADCAARSRNRGETERAGPKVQSRKIIRATSAISRAGPGEDLKSRKCATQRSIFVRVVFVRLMHFWPLRHPSQSVALPLLSPLLHLRRSDPDSITFGGLLTSTRLIAFIQAASKSSCETLAACSVV